MLYPFVGPSAVARMLAASTFVRCKAVAPDDGPRSRVEMMSAAGQPRRGCRRSRRRPMTVKSILSSKGRDVATIEPNATLDTAIALLAQRRIGALVVLGPERRVIGILSERDIVRVLASDGA